MAILSKGAQLKEARLAKGMSQRKVANLVGVAPSTLSGYESDKHECPEDVADAIYEVLGLGAEKIEKALAPPNKLPEVIFKETKTPEPQKDEEPDKFGPDRNHEGYKDPTMAAALSKAMIKYTDHMPGEIWIHQRRNGKNVPKLIISLVGRSTAMCVSIFANGSQLDYKLKTTCGRTKYVILTKFELIPLKELEVRDDVIVSKYLDGLKSQITKLFEIEPVEKVVEKEVKVEVPVEKIVEKEVKVEVPVEKIVEKEVKVEVPKVNPEAEIEARIYKDCFDKVCSALAGVVKGGAPSDV